MLANPSFNPYSTILIGFCCYFFRYVFHQQIGNGILMGTAAAIGLLCYFLGETKQRRAFLEAKQSLEVKMVIEEQSAEQVKRNLLLFNDVRERSKGMKLFLNRKNQQKTITNCETWQK